MRGRPGIRGAPRVARESRFQPGRRPRSCGNTAAITVTVLSSFRLRFDSCSADSDRTILQPRPGHARHADRKYLEFRKVGNEILLEKTS